DDYDGMLKYNVQVKNYADKVTEYATNLDINKDAKKLVLQPRFDMMELSNIMPMRLLDKEKAVLYAALKELEEAEYDEYTIEDLVRKVEEQPTNLKWKVLAGLEALQDSGVFEGTPINLNEIVKKGCASIVNLKGTEPHIQHLVVAKIVKDLFDARCVGKIDEVFVLVEEAHNFCPERGFGDVISSNILRTIASEGRKFGINLCVVSQRPARVDKNVLSQCNTQIILKVTNPNDLRAIGQSIEGFSAGMENEIKQLSVGHALIVGECVEQPVTVDIRVRETKHMGNVAIKKEDDVPEEIKEKAERMKKRHKEMLEKKQKAKVGEVEPKEKTFWDQLIEFFIKNESEEENEAKG
ncbi:MAG: ATP-binding protein, partial [Candidatus Altiarchaeota archaeon]|nr:ATP-binding protein [Candidatus Altiarchaeota archaeon]